MSFPEALMRRRRTRQPMDERLPDGRSVNELLASQPQAPMAQSAISQPMPTSNPSLDAQQQITEGQLANQGFKGAMTRPRRAEPRDYVADDAAYLRGVTNQPHTWRDKLIDVADVVNTVAGGKPRVLPSKRERAIRDAEGRLATDIELQKQALSQMVPVQLDNGQQVMVPARQAGTLQSQQQRIRQTAEQSLERKRVNDARIGRWENMDKSTRMRLLANLYNSGAMNDPEQLEYAADQLGIPGTLRPKFIQGQMRDAIDESGNLIQVNRQTQQVVPVTSEGKPVGAFQKTMEAGRNRRASETQAAITARQAARGTGGQTTDRAAMRRAAVLVGQIERARKEMERADAVGNAKARQDAQMIGEQAAAELNSLGAGYEAGPGEKGYPYYKKGVQTAPAQQGGKYAGKRISQANVAEYGRRHGMSPEDAAEFLKREGAMIY